MSGVLHKSQTMWTGGVVCSAQLIKKINKKNPRSEQLSMCELDINMQYVSASARSWGRITAELCRSGAVPAFIASLCDSPR